MFLLDGRLSFAEFLNNVAHPLRAVQPCHGPEVPGHFAAAVLILQQLHHQAVHAFGSQGAKVMNETMADMMPLAHAEGFPFYHIHATGSFGKEWMPKRVKDNGVDYENCAALDIREYIYNMPTVMAAADLIIGRAGSATCNEIAAAGLPCILIPSPNVTNNHQEKNARVLEEAGGAVVVLEKDCDPEKMYELVKELLADKNRRADMTKALHGLVKTDSAERICDMVEELA